jgi:muramidase (phage lysozyme)
VLDVRTKGQNDIGDPIVGTSNEGLEALYDFQQKVSDWVMANPQANSVDRAKAINDIGNTILKNLAPLPGQEDNPLGNGQNQYNRPANMGFDNPFTQGTGTPQDLLVPSTPEERKARQDAAGAANKGSGFPSPEPAVSDDDVKTLLDGMTPEQLKAIDGRAKAFGLTREEMARKLLTPKPDQRSEASPDFQPVSFSASNNVGNPTMTPQIASQLLDQSLAEVGTTVGEAAAPVKVPVVQGVDPQAQRLIGLILKHEAAGNWNAVFGNAHNTVDLGKYSVNQILAMQVAARSRGAKSTAIGGPQFIYKTLRTLKDDMGLSGTEKFTPQLQTEMAMVLLRKRGWDEYRAGTLSKRAFALNLSQEWASLPDPRTGRSFYDGDGLNAAGTTPSKVYEAMGLTPTLVSYNPSQSTAVANSDVYGDIPDTDASGNPGQREKFMQWNSDPVANNEANMKSINPQLADVIRKAQGYAPDVKIVIGSGKRDPELQKKAVQWGWSKTEESDHLDGSAADLWPVIGGRVKFDPTAQKTIVRAMKRAAKELGVDLEVGADWKRFKDVPHFALRKKPLTA